MLQSSVVLWCYFNTSMECAMLRHCSMPGMSSWSTRRSLHLMVIVPDDPGILHSNKYIHKIKTQTQLKTPCVDPGFDIGFAA